MSNIIYSRLFNFCFQPFKCSIYISRNDELVKTHGLVDFDYFCSLT